MKANEFRLGSLFGYKGCIYAANVIRDNFVYGNNVNGFAPGEFPLDKINPIPLTEEWLLKFGANKYEFDHKANQYRIENMLFVIREDTFFDYGTGVKLQFVHQLQNLYFALTGEELTI